MLRSEKPSKEISSSKQQTRYGIFLSSTNDRFVREYRLAAKFLIESEFKDLWYVVEMDEFKPDNPPPLDVCEKYVKECHIYIGIYGPFYGSINYKMDVSYTEY